MALLTFLPNRRLHAAMPEAPADFSVFFILLLGVKRIVFFAAAHSS